MHHRATQQLELLAFLSVVVMRLAAACRNGTPGVANFGKLLSKKRPCGRKFEDMLNLLGASTMLRLAHKPAFAFKLTSGACVAEQKAIFPNVRVSTGLIPGQAAGRGGSRPWTSSGKATLLQKLREAHDPEVVEDLLDKLQPQDVREHNTAISAAMSSCAKSKNWEQAVSMLDAMRQERLTTDVVTFTAAMTACDKSSQWLQALSIFRSMRSAGVIANAVSFGPAIMACLREGHMEPALSLFDDMRQAGILPNALFLERAAVACNMGGHWMQSLSMLDKIHKAECIAALKTYNAALSACGQAQQWRQALSLFEDVRELGLTPNVLSWSAAISACNLGMQWERALSCFDNMCDARVIPAASTLPFKYALCACENAMLWERALSLLDHLSTSDMTPNAFEFFSVMSACQKSDNLERAASLLDKIGVTDKKPNVVRYNIDMLAFQQHGLWQRALSLLDTMRTAGIPPDGDSINIAMQACESCEQEEQKQSLLNELVGSTLDRGDIVIDTQEPEQDDPRPNKWWKDVAEALIPILTEKLEQSIQERPKRVLSVFESFEKVESMAQEEGPRKNADVESNLQVEGRLEAAEGARQKIEEEEAKFEAAEEARHAAESEANQPAEQDIIEKHQKALRQAEEAQSRALEAFKKVDARLQADDESRHKAAEAALPMPRVAELKTTGEEDEEEEEARRNAEEVKRQAESKKVEEVAKPLEAVLDPDASDVHTRTLEDKVLQLIRKEVIDGLDLTAEEDDWLERVCDVNAELCDRIEDEVDKELMGRLEKTGILESTIGQEPALAPLAQVFNLDEALAHERAPRERISKLKQLLDTSLITEQEYEEKRKEIIDSI